MSLHLFWILYLKILKPIHRWLSSGRLCHFSWRVPICGWIIDRDAPVSRMKTKFSFAICPFTPRVVPFPMAVSDLTTEGTLISRWIGFHSLKIRQQLVFPDLSEGRIYGGLQKLGRSMRIGQVSESSDIGFQFLKSFSRFLHSAHFEELLPQSSFRGL